MLKMQIQVLPAPSRSFLWNPTAHIDVLSNFYNICSQLHYLRSSNHLSNMFIYINNMDPKINKWFASRTLLTPESLRKYSVYFHSQFLSFDCPGCWLHSQIRSWLLLGVNQLLKMQRLRNQKTGKEELGEPACQQAVSGWGGRTEAPGNHQRDSRTGLRAPGTSYRKVRGRNALNLNPDYNLTAIFLI